MGSKTAATIVSEALELAGDTSLTSRANVWLDLFLRDEYRQWDWDFLKRFSQFSLDSGAVSVAMTLTDATQARILNVYAHAPQGTIGASLTSRVRLTNRGLFSGLPTDQHPKLTTTNDTGVPTYYSFDPRDSTGTLYVWPRADQAYTLDVEWIETPADLAGSGTPRYPSDATMVQAVFAMALKHMQDARASEELQRLEVMRNRVRGVEHSADGGYDYLRLDPAFYRGASRWTRWWPWPK